MKQIEFEHYRKAPHPFQQYGNMPPAAFKNRSIPSNYVSLPQGEEAFVHKVGKKIFNQKHHSTIKEHWLGDSGNDSLSQQMAKYHPRVKGKSLQTRDIEGAQGGSLKSSAVKYKQKAQQLKMNGKINGFDRYDFQKEEYRLNIENSIRFNHQKDKNIGRMISNKGHGHILNPQTIQTKSGIQQNKIKKLQNGQNFLKQKYQGFDVRNQKYKQFFTDIKNNEIDYERFFQKPQDNTNYQSSDSRSSHIQQKYTPKIGRKDQDLIQKYQTVDLQQDRYNDNEMRKQYDLWRKQEFLKNYQPPNFSKKSIQNQFRQQQGHTLGHNSSLVYDNKQYSLNPSLAMSRKEQYDSKGEHRVQTREPKIVRRNNPTNLSNPIGSYKLGADYSF